ncbi:MAG TPA: hypothetical protein PKW05_04850 [Anaerolineae bacterium]|nr:hypothetical protein [Anaerolineae bacterium]
MMTYDQRARLRVAVIGPTDIAVTSRAAGLDPDLCRQAAGLAGTELARRGCTVVLVPDRGVALVAAEAYRRAGGPHLVGIVPRGGTSTQQATSCCEEHRSLCDEVIEDLTWSEQHERICQLADVMLCIGLSCGTIAEVAWTKWTGQHPVIVVRSLVSGIPPEVLAEIDVRWVEDLDEALSEIDALADRPC